MNLKDKLTAIGGFAALTVVLSYAVITHDQFNQIESALLTYTLGGAYIWHFYKVHQRSKLESKVEYDVGRVEVKLDGLQRF